MLIFLPLVVYLLLASFSLTVLAFLLYCHDPHGPEVRFAAVVTGVLGVVSLAEALLVWIESISRRRPHSGTRTRVCGKRRRSLRSGAVNQRLGETVRPLSLPSCLQRVDLPVLVVPTSTTRTG